MNKNKFRHYPSVYDTNFNEKIYKKKEFYKYRIPEQKDLTEDEKQKQLKDKCSNNTFVLTPIQNILKNFFNQLSPYNGLLLVHGTGTGKTCTSLQILQSMGVFDKEYIKYKPIVLITKANLYDNYYNEMWSSEKYDNNIPQCLADRFKPLKGEKSIVKKLFEAPTLETISSKSEIIIKECKNNSQKMKKMYGNKIIVIDEIHNIKTDGKEKKTSKNEENINKRFDTLAAILETTEGTSKLLLLSATPMTNDARQILNYFKLLLIASNDYRNIIRIFKDIITEEQIRELKIKGVKNNIITPLLNNIFTKKAEFKENGKDIFEKLCQGYVSFFRGENPITFPKKFYPKDVLKLPIKYDKNSYGKDASIEIKKLKLVPFNYSEKQVEIITNPKNALFKDFLSKGRIYDTIVDYDKHKGDKKFLTISANDGHLHKISPKIDKIINEINKTKGIVFVYSDLVTQHLKPFIEILKINGFRDEQIGILIGKTKNREAIRNNVNKKDTKIKVLIGSSVASEGLSFKRIRQVHLLVPLWNMSDFNQVIGRAIRHCSHSDLPIEEQNVKIFNWIAQYKNDKKRETVSGHILSNAEMKEIKIKNVERIMKENSIDCCLLKENNVRSDDVDNSFECDYQKCDYKCNIKCNDLTKKQIDNDTHDLIYHTTEVNNLKKNIIKLFKYDSKWSQADIEKQLKIELNRAEVDEYLDYSLYELVSEKEIIEDKYKRKGYIQYKPPYFVFLPIIFKEVENMPLRYRSKPSRKYETDISLKKEIKKEEKNTDKIMDSIKNKLINIYKESSQNIQLVIVKTLSYLSKIDTEILTDFFKLFLSIYIQNDMNKEIFNTEASFAILYKALLKTELLLNKYLDKTPEDKIYGIIFRNKYLIINYNTKKIEDSISESDKISISDYIKGITKNNKASIYGYIKSGKFKLEFKLEYKNKKQMANSYTIDELKNVCKDLNIKYSKKDTKEKLITNIEYELRLKDKNDKKNIWFDNKI